MSHAKDTMKKMKFVEQNRELQLRGYELEEFYRPNNCSTNSFISNWIGTFRQSYHSTTVDMCVIKIINKKTCPVRYFSKIIPEELKILDLVGNHENIAKLCESFSSAKNLYVISEYSDLGSLARYQSMLNLGAEMEGRQVDAETGVVSDMQARHLSLQLAAALDHCHNKGVVHRNVCPRSVLLDTGCNLKLSDFTDAVYVANTYRPLVTTPPRLKTAGSASRVGAGLAAPECFSGRKYNGPYADVWGVGVVLFTMVTGYPPNSDCNDRTVSGSTLLYPEHIKQDTKTMITNLLKYHGEERVTLKQFVDSKWIEELVNHQEKEQAEKEKEYGEFTLGIMAKYKDEIAQEEKLREEMESESRKREEKANKDDGDTNNFSLGMRKLYSGELKKHWEKYAARHKIENFGVCTRSIGLSPNASVDNLAKSNSQPIRKKSGKSIVPYEKEIEDYYGSNKSNVALKKKSSMSIIPFEKEIKEYYEKYRNKDENSKETLNVEGEEALTYTDDMSKFYDQQNNSEGSKSVSNGSLPGEHTENEMSNFYANQIPEDINPEKTTISELEYQKQVSEFYSGKLGSWKQLSEEAAITESQFDDKLSEFYSKQISEADTNTGENCINSSELQHDKQEISEFYGDQITQGSEFQEDKSSDYNKSSFYSSQMSENDHEEGGEIMRPDIEKDDVNNNNNMMVIGRNQQRMLNTEFHSLNINGCEKYEPEYHHGYQECNLQRTPSREEYRDCVEGKPVFYREHGSTLDYSQGPGDLHGSYLMPFNSPTNSETAVGDKGLVPCSYSPYGGERQCHGGGEDGYATPSDGVVGVEARTIQEPLKPSAVVKRVQFNVDQDGRAIDGGLSRVDENLAKLEGSKSIEDRGDMGEAKRVQMYAGQPIQGGLTPVVNYATGDHGFYVDGGDDEEEDELGYCGRLNQIGEDHHEQLGYSSEDGQCLDGVEVIGESGGEEMICEDGGDIAYDRDELGGERGGESGGDPRQVARDDRAGYKAPPIDDLSTCESSVADESYDSDFSLGVARDIGREAMLQGMIDHVGGEIPVMAVGKAVTSRSRSQPSSSVPGTNYRVGSTEHGKGILKSSGMARLREPVEEMSKLTGNRSKKSMEKLANYQGQRNDEGIEQMRRFSTNEMISIPYGMTQLDDDEDQDCFDEYGYNSESSMDNDIVSYLKSDSRNPEDDFFGNKEDSDLEERKVNSRPNVVKNSFYGRAFASANARKLPLPRVSSANTTKASKVNINFGKVASEDKDAELSIEEDMVSKKTARITEKTKNVKDNADIKDKRRNTTKDVNNIKPSTPTNKSPIPMLQSKQTLTKTNNTGSIAQNRVPKSPKKKVTAGVRANEEIGHKTPTKPAPSANKRILVGCTPPRHQTKMEKMREALIRSSRIAVETYRRPIGDVLSKDDDPADYPQVPDSVMSSRQSVREYFTSIGL